MLKVGDRVERVKWRWAGQLATVVEVRGSYVLIHFDTYDADRRSIMGRNPVKGISWYCEMATLKLIEIQLEND